MLTASSSTTAIKLLKIATFRFDIRFAMGVTMRDRSLIRQVSLWMGVILPLALAVPAWPATLTVTPTTIVPGGIVTVTVAGGPGTAEDCVGLNLAGTNLIAPFVPALQWKYTASASTMSFTMPATAGGYDFRLYQNCSNTKLLATSGPVTVGVVIVPPVSTVVLASQSVTVMVTGGPGGALDWLGLFLATAPDTAYLDWVRMNGTKSTPATGATTG